MRIKFSLIFLFVCSVVCFLPFMNAALALILGIIGATLFKIPYDLSRISSLILKYSIVFLGFGLNWSETLSTSKSGILLTAFTVTFTLLLGIVFGKILKLNLKTTLLISIGTAICGGSAIAAVSPIIHARNEQFALALVVIFSLNAIALLIFPIAGQILDLNQTTFGIWSAISIHDTSSVVGAAAMYGNEALEVATAMKLTRALWIVPAVVCLSLFGTKAEVHCQKLPWFILLFVLAILLSNSLPEWSVGFEFLSWLGKKALIVVLFLVGTTFDHAEIRKTGRRDFLLGIVLWITISIMSLLFLVYF
jgi:uncharacterized integral membrane protein (TIGR00698 family)